MVDLRDSVNKNEVTIYPSSDKIVPETEKYGKLLDSQSDLLQVHVEPNLMTAPESYPSVINGGYGHYRDQSCGSTTPLTNNCGNTVMDDALACGKKDSDIRNVYGGKNGFGRVICKSRDRNKKKWNFSLFSCHRDLRTCLCTMVCPYVTQYRIGANSGNPKLAKCLVFIVICMVILSLLRLLPFLETHFNFPASSFVGQFKWPIYLTLVLLGMLVVGIRLYILAKLRKQIRDEREILGSRFSDHVTILFCFWCSLCQMKRELDRTAAKLSADSEIITKATAPQNFNYGTSPFNGNYYAPLNPANTQISSSGFTNSSSNYDSNLNVIVETQKETKNDRQIRNMKNSASMIVIGKHDEIQVDDIEDHSVGARRCSLDYETFHCCCDCEQTSNNIPMSTDNTKLKAMNLTLSH